VVIEGEYRGADQIAKSVALELGFEVEPYVADWAKMGLRAGPARNKRMLEEGRPDLVVAFHDHLMASKGTKNMVAQAEAAGVPWVCVSSSPVERESWPAGMLCAFCENADCESICAWAVGKVETCGYFEQKRRW